MTQSVAPSKYKSRGVMTAPCLVAIKKHLWLVLKQAQISEKAKCGLSPNKP